MPPVPARRFDNGFTLVEVLVALGLTVVIAVGAAELFMLGVRGHLAARQQTTAAVLSSEKLEQLRSLAWRVDGLGQPVSDTTTDVSASPFTAAGRGLASSPQDSLDVDRPGYVDHLDARGGWVGNGVTAPAAAVFTRRWSIQPSSASSGDTLVLQVLVTPIRRGAPAVVVSAFGAGDPVRAFMVTVRTRTAW